MAGKRTKTNGGGLGRTGRNNGLTLKPKPKSKPAGKTGSTKNTDKKTTVRRKTGKRG